MLTFCNCSSRIFLFCYRGRSGRFCFCDSLRSRGPTGTYAYMAPECYDNHVTPKVDVWALGIAAELHMSEMCEKFVRLRYVRFHKVFLPSALEIGWKPPVGQVSRDM